VSQESWEQLFAPRLPLVGRSEEFSRLLSLTQSASRMITLFGAAGVGKTRLSIELLRSPLWQKRASYCDVSASKNAPDLCNALTRALKIPAATIDGRADPVLAVGQWLNERGPGLIVLDNFEHLVSSCASLLALWREAAPQICWVVTSRQLLRLPGEEVFSLDTLPTPEEGDTLENIIKNSAVQFFMACAPNISIEKEASKIASLVRRLDGLPLAIRLAAGRLEVLSLEDLMARLRDPFPVLKEPGVTGRSGALWDSLEDSWVLLGPEEQTLLRRVSVLVGSFNLEAAEEVAGFPTDATLSVLDALQLLYRKSLLRMSSREVGRFGMYESVRAFASQKLGESTERDEALAHHAAYFSKKAKEWTEKAFGDDATLYLSLIFAESDNINAALQRSLTQTEQISVSLACMRALSRSNYIAWWLKSGIDLLDATLLAAEAAPHLSTQDQLHLAWLLERKARNCTDQGKNDEGILVLERGLNLAQNLGEKRLEGILLRRLANVFFMQGRRDEAAELNQRSLALLRATKDTQQEGILHCLMGIQGHMRGQNDEAESHFLAALPLLQNEVDKRFEGYCYGRLGMIRMSQLRLDEARSFMSQSFRVMSQIGPSEEAGARGELATLSHIEGKLDEAKLGYYNAIEVFRRFKIKHYSAYLLYNYAGLLLERRELADAEKAIEESHKIFSEVRFSRDLALAKIIYAGLFILQGSWKKAEEFLRAADEEAARDDIVREVQSVYKTLLSLTKTQKQEPDNRVLSKYFAEAQLQYERLVPFQQDDVMIALRVLASKIEEVREVGSAWRIANDGSFFQPNGEATVNISSRKTMARLLAALVKHRTKCPGEPLSLAELADTGWPGNRGKWSSLTNNLHVTLNALRRVGLEAILVRQEGGYLLDPKIPVLIEENL
jgi:predicted ATPase